MYCRTLVLSFLVILLIGCDGPAERAGENLDAQVGAARTEVAQLERQIEEYKQEMEQIREELAASKDQLGLARKELEEMKRSRQEILQQMESVQEMSKTGNFSPEQHNYEEQKQLSSPPQSGINDTPNGSSKDKEQEKDK